MGSRTSEFTAPMSKYRHAFSWTTRFQKLRTLPGQHFHQHGAPGRKKSLNISINYSDSNRPFRDTRPESTECTHRSNRDEEILSHVSKDYQIHTQGPSCPRCHQRRIVGIYVNSQQFDTLFLKEAFDTSRYAGSHDPRAGNGRPTLATARQITAVSMNSDRFRRSITCMESLHSLCKGFGRGAH